LAASYRRAARLGGGGELVVMPDPDVDAYALPGWPSRIVVTTGLLEALSPGGRRAVLAHEHAHLARRHHWFVTIAHLAAAANPLLRPLARAVDYTVERWADEQAAVVVGDRRVVATAIAQTALLAQQHRRRPHRRHATLGAARGMTPGMTLAGAGPVPRRVAALLAPPPTDRIALFSVAVLLVASAGLSALEAAHDLDALLELALAAARNLPGG